MKGDFPSYAPFIQLSSYVQLEMILKAARVTQLVSSQKVEEK